MDEPFDWSQLATGWSQPAMRGSNMSDEQPPTKPDPKCWQWSQDRQAATHDIEREWTEDLTGMEWVMSTWTEPQPYGGRAFEMGRVVIRGTLNGDLTIALEIDLDPPVT